MTASTPIQNAPATLGERIRAARRERGLSQSTLAGEELTKGFISQVESGLVRPSLRSLQILANRLGKPLDYFLGDETLASAKRVTFHRLGAQAAAERGDWEVVRTESASVLERSPEPRERARVLSLLAGADLAAGHPEAAFAHIDEALALVEPATDAAEVAGLLYRRGVAYTDLGQLGAATEAFESARTVIEQNEVIDARLRSRVLVALGTMYRRLNRTAKAMATYEAALSLATRSSEVRLAARSYMGVAAALYDSAEYEGAIANYERALTLWERLADTDFELNALQSLAGVHFDNQDFAQARELAIRCQVRAESVGDVRWAAVGKIEQARVLLVRSQTSEALALAVEAERELATVSDNVQHAAALRVMGSAHDALGDHDASDVCYRRAVDLVTAIEDLATRSVIAAEYAQKLRSRGQLDAAYDMLELARGSSAKH